MPGYKTHLVGGTLSFVVVYYLTTFITQLAPLLSIFCFSATLVGALFPDLDVTSKIQHIFYILLGSMLLGAIIIKHWLFFISGGVLAIIVALLKHRTILHRPWFLVIFSLVGVFIFNIYQPTLTKSALVVALFFTIGTLSHVTLDAVTSKFFKWH